MTTSTSPAPERGAAAADDTALVTVRDLHVRNTLTGVDVVRGVSLTLRRGQVVGIVGESGSGKTLTCRTVLGIAPPIFETSRGSVEILGRDTSTFSAREWQKLRGTTITAVFQDPASYLNPAIKIGKQLAEVLRVHRGLTRAQARERTVELLSDVRLRDPARVAGQYPHELSGGMLQRVLIAAAVSIEPRVLIADEVTTALDVTVQAEILDLLVDLQRSTDLSLIVVSHDLAVVAQVCDEVLVMREGQVVEHGATADVLHHPKHEYTRLLVDEHHQYGLDRYLTGADVRRTSHVA